MDLMELFYNGSNHIEEMKFQESLRELNPYVSRPSLPNRFLFSMFSSQRQCDILAKFLGDVITTKEHRANRALHLFLQTNLSLEDIRLNIEGLRNDDVPDFPLVDKRNNSSNGFSQIFLAGIDIICIRAIEGPFTVLEPILVDILSI